MKDTILRPEGAMKELGMSEKNFYRYLKARAFPFLRTGFYQDMKGRLYFSKIRLHERFEAGERMLVRDEENKEMQLAINLLQFDIKMGRLLDLLERDLTEDEKEDVDFDLDKAEEEGRELLKEYDNFVKQRLEGFFGREATIRFFPKMFPVEAKRREQAMKHDFYNLQYGKPMEIEAERLKKERAEAERRRKYFHNHFLSEPGDNAKKGSIKASGSQRP